MQLCDLRVAADSASDAVGPSLTQASRPLPVLRQVAAEAQPLSLLAHQLALLVFQFAALVGLALPGGQWLGTYSILLKPFPERCAHLRHFGQQDPVLLFIRITLIL